MSRARALAVLVLLALAGCGFQLRGAFTVPPELARMYVDANDPYGPLAQEVRGMLTRAGAALVTERAKATAVFILTGPTTRRRPLSVDTAGRVREYQTQMTVRFRVDTPDGAAVIPEHGFELSRDYVYVGSAVLGKEEEEALLQAEMRREATGRIAARLRAWSERER